MVRLSYEVDTSETGTRFFKNSAPPKSTKEGPACSKANSDEINDTKSQSMTWKLTRVLGFYDILESQSGLRLRREILRKLEKMLKKWVRDVSESQGVPAEKAKQLGARLYTFGSYRLGVHQKDADIDAVCVVPENIERSEFFKSFYGLLKARPEVSECLAVEHAFVPIIKLKFQGVEIDLLIARLALEKIPIDLDTKDTRLLENMDAESVRSLNGRRVTDEILDSVPNKDAFRLALRVIKLWAKRNGLYSNILGYLGGVSWAIMVAKVCQIYPDASAITLVHEFFQLFANWEWPKPVFLKRPENVDYGFRVWDPRGNIKDRFHLMPIITPAYPYQNTTFNVSVSTMKVLMKEISRGAKIMDNIISGKSEWHTLFQGSIFFLEYKHFLVLTVKSPNTDDHSKWSRFIESKIRHFVGMLDRDRRISLAHVKPGSFGPKMETAGCSHWLIGLEFRHIGHLNLDLHCVNTDFVEMMYSCGTQNGMMKQGMTLEVTQVERNQLTKFFNIPRKQLPRFINGDSL